MTKVVHITSVHSRDDTRIFLKQCCSLAEDVYELTLLVADGKGDQRKKGVDIIDIGKFDRRLVRMLVAPYLMFFKSLKFKGKLYHIHDPELMITGIFLRILGKTVIYDSHENLRKQLLSKPYLNIWMAKILSLLIAPIELIFLNLFSHVITANSSIAECLHFVNSRKITVINNYPNLDHFWEPNHDRETKCKKNGIFVGAITKIRGIEHVITALEINSKVKLDLVGGTNDHAHLSSLRDNQGWSHVNEHGFLPQATAFEMMKSSIFGVVTYLPFPNHINSQPNKIFEYMAAGIPIIASNFPLWIELVEETKVGLCINPDNPSEISSAIDFILENPEEAEQMGLRGRNLVQTRFNWAVEKSKLLRLYSTLLEKK